MNWTSILVAIIMASNGLWSLVLYKVTRNDKKKDLIEEGLLAVLHDRLYQGCRYFLAEDEISVEDLDNMKYLYEAYDNLGGNGTGTELYNRIRKLKLKD